MYPLRTTRTPVFWDTPCRPMIIHTSDSHQIPSQNKTKLQILKNCQKFKFWYFARNVTCFWSCLIRCINMKWIQPELEALQSRHRMWDGRTDRVKPKYPSTTSLCRGYNYCNHSIKKHNKTACIFWDILCLSLTKIKTSQKITVFSGIKKLK